MVRVGATMLRARALNRAEYAAVRDAHPATAPGEPWGEGFPPALIAASLEVPEDWARQWWDEEPPDVAYELLGALQRLSGDASFDYAVEVLRRNPRRLLEVKTARTLGLGLTAFLSLPVVDQDYALAAVAIEGDVCPGCGVPNDDRLNPRAPWKVQADACVHCRRIRDAEGKIGDEDRGSIHVRLVPQ